MAVLDQAPIDDKLTMSTRTLQRSLQQEGPSFRELLDSTRHELANNFLRQKKLSLTEICYLPGSSDLKSLHQGRQALDRENAGGLSTGVGTETPLNTSGRSRHYKKAGPLARPGFILTKAVRRTGGPAHRSNHRFDPT